MIIAKKAFIVSSLLALSCVEPTTTRNLRADPDNDETEKQFKVVATITTKESPCNATFYANRKEEEVFIAYECPLVDDESSVEKEATRDEAQMLVSLYESFTGGAKKAPKELAELDDLLENTWSKKKRYRSSEYTPPPPDDPLELDESALQSRRLRMDADKFARDYCGRPCPSDDWDQCMVYRSCGSRDSCTGGKLNGYTFRNTAYVYDTGRGSSGMKVSVQDWKCNWHGACRWTELVDHKWQGEGNNPRTVISSGSDRDRRAIFRAAKGDGFHYANSGSKDKPWLSCYVSTIGQS